jgi:hypothetical protein
MQDVIFGIILGVTVLLFVVFLITSVASLFILLGAPDDFNDVDIQGNTQRKTNE